MYNVKQLREKYENIKQMNPNRNQSARSSHSQTPSKQQYEVAFSTSQKSQKQSIIQIGKTLLCSPCYNKRLLNQKEKIVKQEQELEKRLFMQQLEQNCQIEQEKINYEIGQQSYRKQVEQQNLIISQQNMQQQKEQEKLEKELEIQQQNLIIKKNQEQLQKEKLERREKQKSLHQGLSEQLTQQQRLRNMDALSQSMEINDPYWRFQQQEEKELEKRKNYQTSYVNNKWKSHEQQKLQIEKEERINRSKEIDQRIKTLQEYHNQLEQEKQEKQKIQKQLIMDLNAQIRLKKTKEEAQRLLERQKQKQREQEVIKLENDRQYSEIYNKKKIGQQMLDGLNKQIEFQKQQNNKSQEKQLPEDNYILKPIVEKTQIPCADCKKKNVPSLLSQL